MYAASNPCVILTFPSGAHVEFRKPGSDEVINSIDLPPGGRLQYEHISDVALHSFIAENSGRVYHVTHDHGYLKAYSEKKDD